MRCGAMGTLLGKAGENKSLVGVRPNTLEPSPQLKLDVDRLQAQAMGLEVGDILQRDPVDAGADLRQRLVQGGRVNRVNMHSDGPFRTGPNRWPHYYTPSKTTMRNGLPTMIRCLTWLK